MFIFPEESATTRNPYKLVCMTKVEVLKNSFTGMIFMIAKDKVFYTRLVAALGAGIVNSLLGFYDLRGLLLAGVMLVVSHYFEIYLLNVDPVELGGQWKMFTIGIFSFLFLGIVIWTLTFNLITVPGLFPNGLPPL